jgi:hypothetical protein
MSPADVGVASAPRSSRRADWPNYSRTNGKPPTPRATDRKGDNLRGPFPTTVGLDLGQ